LLKTSKLAANNDSSLSVVVQQTAGKYPNAFWLRDVGPRNSNIKSKATRTSV